MMMTEEGYRTWLLDPETPNELLRVVLEENTTLDWPIPTYLLEDLQDLAATKEPAQESVDEARIPLLNWFRQQREEAAAKASGLVELPSTDDVLGPLG